MKKVLAMLLALTMAFGLVACSSSTDSSSDGAVEVTETEAAETEAEAEAEESTDEVTEWGDLVWGFSGSWNTLFPPSTTNQMGVLVYNFLWEPLVQLTETGFAYRAAENIDIEDDGYTWYVTLRPDVTFTDGVPCTAEDWVFSLNMLTDPDFGVYNFSGQMSIIAGTNDMGQRIDGEEFGVEYIDDYNFVIRFSQPMSFATFCGTYTNHFKAYPKHLLEDIPIDEISTCDFWSHPLGNGICVFVDEPVAGEELILQARSDGFYLGDPKFNMITFRVVDRTNAANALMNGEIDTYYASLENSDIEMLEEQADNLYIQSFEGSGSWYSIIVNNERYDANVRKAMDLMIDKQLLCDALYSGKAIPIGDSGMPGADYYIPYEDTVDVDAAVALLEEAGWDFDNDVLTIGCSESTENVAIMIQQMCAEGGMQIKIETGDLTTFYAEMRSGDRDAVIASDSMYYTPLIKASELATGPASMTHATNPEYLELCNTIAFCTDHDEEMELYAQLLELLRAECPEVYLYFVPAEIPVNNRISGFNYGMLNLPWEWVVLPE